jgi:hypothetical protein
MRSRVITVIARPAAVIRCVVRWISCAVRGYGRFQLGWRDSEALPLEAWRYRLLRNGLTLAR